MANLLLIFEGEKSEFEVVKSLSNHYLNEKENILIQTAYCNDIYELYKQIVEDPDLDIFELIRNIPSNKKILEDFSRIDFAEIYMFFDYDGHDNLADDSHLLDLLNLFDQETENGKLYISYPMVESIRHIPTNIDFKDLIVKAKKNIKYKKVVDEETEGQYKNINSYSREIWNHIIVMHTKKMNFITRDKFELPKTIIHQSEILENQIEKYISQHDSISVLNSFPIFILDYYGLNFIKKIAS